MSNNFHIQLQLIVYYQASILNDFFYTKLSRFHKSMDDMKNLSDKKVMERTYIVWNKIFIRRRRGLLVFGSSTNCK